jgi:signal peptidase I
MQCPNCSFENMPGLKSCARCGSMLEIGNIGLEPPRARALHMKTRFWRWLNPLREGVNVSTQRMLDRLTHWMMPREIKPLAIVLTLIPGCGHLHDRQRYLGWGLLAGWSVMLLLALIMLGTEWHNLFWFIAIFIHAYAFLHLLVMSVYNQTWLVTRALLGLCFFFGLRMFVYFPAGQLGSSFYSVFPVSDFMPNPVVHPDDVLLYEGALLRPDKFSHGDLIVYRIERSTFGHTIVASGLNIDRIVGIPGDHVKFVSGSILVNGIPLPPEQGPLSTPRINDWETTLQEEQYMILPTCLVMNQYSRLHLASMQSLLKTVSIVEKPNIRGRVVFRLRPWNHWGRVR